MGTARARFEEAPPHVERRSAVSTAPHGRPALGWDGGGERS
ncbi:hypothetical protein [Sorangium sp. So ce381]